MALIQRLKYLLRTRVGVKKVRHVKLYWAIRFPLFKISLSASSAIQWAIDWTVKTVHITSGVYDIKSTINCPYGKIVRGKSV